MPVIRSPFSPGEPSSSQPSVPASRSTRSAGEDFSSYISRLAGVQIGPTPRPRQEAVEQVSVPSRLSVPARPVAAPTEPVDDGPDFSSFMDTMRQRRQAGVSPSVAGQQDVSDTVADLQRRLARSVAADPETSATAMLQAERLAAGETAEEPLWKRILEPVVSAGSTAYSYTLGQVGRGIGGAAKEISDVLREGEDASWNDWVDYWTGRKELTYPGWDAFVDKVIGDRKIFIGERGETVPGQIANFAANVPEEVSKAILKATPYALPAPETYVTFGSGALAGGSGRLALAGRLSRPKALELAPSLSGKIGRIAREGEFALTAAEREVLTAAGLIDAPGIRFMGRPIAGTGGAQRVIGGAATRARARVGDVAERIRFGQRSSLLDFVTPESLTPYQGLFRGRVDGREALVRAAGYTSSRTAASAGERFLQQQGYEAFDLVDELLQSPERNILFEAIENPSALDDPASIVFNLSPEGRDLGQRLIERFAAIRDSANQTVQEFAARRGLRASGIGEIDNYFFHTLSPDASRWVIDTRNAKGKQAGIWGAVQENLDVSAADLRGGSAPVRHRTLKKDKKFLGQTMREDGILEANRISREVLGFDWFETDAASVLTSYIDSVARQVKRIEFFDQLFEYGPEFVRPIVQELVPDKEWAAEVNAIVTAYDKLINSVGRRISGESSAAAQNLNAVRKGAQAVLNKADEDAVRTVANLEQLSDRIPVLRRQLEQAEAAAAKRGDEAKAAFDLFVKPMKDRLDSLQAAVDAGDVQSELARQWLVREHTKLFPKRKNRPTTPDRLAAEIVGEKKRQVERKVKSLTTRRARAQRTLSPESGVSRAKARAEGRMEALEEPLETAAGRADRLKIFADDMVESDIFPEGVMFTTDDQLAGGVAVLTNDAADIPAGAGAVALPAPIPQDIFDLVDDINAWRLVSANTPEEFGEIIVDLTGDQALAGEFVDEALRLFGGGRGGAPLPTLPQEISDMLVLIDGVARMTDVDEDTVVTMFNALADQIDTISQVYGRGPVPPEVGFDLVRDIFVRSMPVPEGPYSVALVPDLEEGWITVLPNQVMAMHDPRAAVAARAVREGDDIFEDVAGVPVRQAADEAEEVVESIRQQRAAAGRQVLESEERLAAAQLEATTAGRQIGGAKAGLTRAELAAQERAGQALEQQLVTVDGDIIPLEKARRVTGAQQRQYDAAKKKFNEVMAADPVNVTLRGARGDLNTSVKNFDMARAQNVDNQYFDQYMRPMYEDDINALVDLVAERPPTGASADEVNRWLRKIETTRENLRIADLTPEQSQAMDRILTQLWSAEAELAALETRRATVADLAQQVADGLSGAVLADSILEGWTAIGNLGLQVAPDVADDMLRGVMALRNPNNFNSFLKAYFAYQRFFKAYAILTPGFTVRNAITAAVNNTIAPYATLKDQLDGIEFARRLFATRKGTASDIDSVIASYPKDEQPLIRRAYDMYLGAGGGQALDDALPMAKGAGSRAYNNMFTRAGRGLNEAVELAARMGLGLGAARSGLDVAQGRALIARWHFDYTDLSGLDRTAKAFIPFWTFASRNIPLQFVNQFSRPGVYQFYDRMRENDAGEVDPNWQKWVRDRNPLVADDGSYINLDLPWIELEEQIANIGSPRKLLAQSNPLLRTIVEGIAGESMAFGTPFSEQKREAGVLDYPAAALSAALEKIGIGEGVSRGPEGELLISDITSQLLGNVVPPAQQFQRIVTPFLPEEAQAAVGGPPRYRERDVGTTVAGYLGLPAGRPTPSQLEGEQRRRRYAIQEIIDDLRKRGIIQ